MSKSIYEVLIRWTKKTEIDLQSLLKENNLEWNFYDDEKTSKLVCEGLELICKLPREKFNAQADANINKLIILCYRTDSPEAEEYMRLNAFMPLMRLFDRLESEPIETDSFNTTEMEILKLVSAYGKIAQFLRLTQIIQMNFMPDNYVWEKIYKNIGESDPKTEFILDGLSGFIPQGFAGIAYLDMCNLRAIQDEYFEHPFNSERGFEWMTQVIQSNSKALKKESHLVSITTSLSFLDAEYRTKLTAQIESFDSIKLQIELAWSGARLGDENSIQKLIDLAKDYRTSKIAEHYLSDLNLHDKIPLEIQNPDFQALRKMCDWLSHPNEYSKSPDSAKITSKKELYWPAADETKTIYIIEYKYNSHETIGVGVVGSRTFSLTPFDTGDYNTEIHRLDPQEIYGIYALWELGQIHSLKEKNNNKINPKVASDFIKLHNSDIKW